MAFKVNYRKMGKAKQEGAGGMKYKTRCAICGKPGAISRLDMMHRNADYICKHCKKQIKRANKINETADALPKRS